MMGNTGSLRWVPKVISYRTLLTYFIVIILSDVHKTDTSLRKTPEFSLCYTLAFTHVTVIELSIRQALLYKTGSSLLIDVDA